MTDTRYGMRRVLSTGTTDTTVASRVVTVTEPTTVTNPGLLDLAAFGPQTPTYIKVIPFGQLANNGVFKTFVLGWDCCQVSGSTVNQWFPSVLAEIACTCGTMVGTSGTASVVAATTLDRMCDSLAVTQGNANVNVSVIAPTSERVGSFIVDLQGCQYPELVFESSGKANAVWKPLS